jgi:hypothetical protein
MTRRNFLGAVTLALASLVWYTERETVVQLVEFSPISNHTINHKRIKYMVVIHSHAATVVSFDKKPSCTEVKFILANIHNKIEGMELYGWGHSKLQKIPLYNGVKVNKNARIVA